MGSPNIPDPQVMRLLIALQLMRRQKAQDQWGLDIPDRFQMGGF